MQVNVLSASSTDTTSVFLLFLFVKHMHLLCQLHDASHCLWLRGEHLFHVARFQMLPPLPHPFLKNLFMIACKLRRKIIYLLLNRRKLQHSHQHAHASRARAAGNRCSSRRGRRATRRAGGQILIHCAAQGAILPEALVSQWEIRQRGFAAGQ